MYKKKLNQVPAQNDQKKKKKFNLVGHSSHLKVCLLKPDFFYPRSVDPVKGLLAAWGMRLAMEGEGSSGDVPENPSSFPGLDERFFLLFRCLLELFGARDQSRLLQPTKGDKFLP